MVASVVAVSVVEGVPAGLSVVVVKDICGAVELVLAPVVLVLAALVLVVVAAVDELGPPEIVAKYAEPIRAKRTTIVTIAA